MCIRARLVAGRTKLTVPCGAPVLQYGGQDAGFCFGFDEPLSHLIYAACDIILVPSMFEPCGLTQVNSGQRDGIYLGQLAPVF